MARMNDWIIRYSLLGKFPHFSSHVISLSLSLICLVELKIFVSDLNFKIYLLIIHSKIFCYAVTSAPLNARLVASSNNCLSTDSTGSWTYRTTDPRMKILLTDNKWGKREGSRTSIFVNLIFKYWSTEWRIPLMARSFFNSTMTNLPIKLLKKEKKCWKMKRIIN